MISYFVCELRRETPPGEMVGARDNKEHRGKHNRREGVPLFPLD